MARGPKSVFGWTRALLVFLATGLVLTGCEVPGTGPQPQHMTREALIASFNGNDINAIVWPSEGQGDLKASGTVLNVWGIKELPPFLQSKYGNDPMQKETALILYKKTLLRDLDNNLSEIYFNSKLGKRELRRNYVYELSRRCKGLSRPKRTRLNKEMENFLLTGTPVPPFVCKSDPQLSEKPLA